MQNHRIYVDYNATTPLNKEVKAAMIEDLEIYGNASSMHTSGRLAHARVEEARAAVGALLGTKGSSIIFTSGGSESNNTVFQTMGQLAAAGKTGGRTGVITTAIEHPCVLNSGKHLQELGWPVTFLPVDRQGTVKLDALKAALNDKTLLVSVMMANNEIGTVQDIQEIARLAKAAGAYMHTDAVQAVGKIPVNAPFQA
jgi:cysteine desulfurase